MNGTIIMFPIKMQQAKPLNAVQRIKQKNDPT